MVVLAIHGDILNQCLILTAMLRLRLFYRRSIFYPLIAGILLSACSPTPYPEAIQQELLSYCQSGIHSGKTVVHHGKKQALTEREIHKLCQFRLQEFMKQVSLEEYLRLNQHIYENFQRAYGYKYVLNDIYNTLSPDDKAVNAKIAEIILGLEGHYAK